MEETILQTLQHKKHKSVSVNGKETTVVLKTVLEPKCHIGCLALFSKLVASGKALHE
jgi:hypothetical protein